MSEGRIQNVIFDLGGVLVDWSPKYLYDKIFSGDKKKVDWFLSTICTNEWNVEQDAGRTLAEATRSLIREHPDQEAHIRAYYDRWEEMLNGEIKGTIDILEDLKQRNLHKLYALTNWSAETFPIALQRFSFLSHFQGIVVSGEENTRKPFRAIYDILLDRYDLDPGRSLFIDDSQANVEAAEEAGIKSILFTGSGRLRKDLKELGILDA
jgi:2-haloacid dehalogenase